MGFLDPASPEKIAQSEGKTSSGTLDTKVSSIPSSNCFTPRTSGLIAIVRDKR
jgi:hypothetical protein